MAAAPKLPPLDTAQVTQYYVEMLEPQSDAELGRKLKMGEVLRVPEDKARRMVEHTGIAKLTTEKAYKSYLDKKAQAAEEARARASEPVFGAHIANANALNANFASLSRDPDAFDTARLPRQDAAALSAAERRGMAERLGQRSAGDATLEEQLAALDASEVAKGNIPVSAGMKGDEFLHSGQSATHTEQTGAVGRSGVAAPTFEDLGDDPSELEDDGEEEESDAPSPRKPRRK